MRKGIAVSRRNDSEDADIDGKMLEKQDVEMWSGFS
jgi:hypothetical protein